VLYEEVIKVENLLKKFGSFVYPDVLLTLRWSQYITPSMRAIAEAQQHWAVIGKVIK
jgi:hypothetical protein